MSVAIVSEAPRLGTTTMAVWRAWRAMRDTEPFVLVGRTGLGVEYAWFDQPNQARTLFRLTGFAMVPITIAEEDAVFDAIGAGELVIGLRRRGLRTLQGVEAGRLDLAQILHPADRIRLPIQ